MTENKNKKVMYSIIGIAILLISLVGVTYSFFNYTRTGALNNLGTGRIYFNSTQNGTLNMTNIFPLTSTQAGEAQLDTVTVGIVGDTTYADGEEFEITLVDITNTINGKQIPINYIATYAATTGNSIGTSSDTYWEARNSKNADIYTLNETGSVEEGKQVLVGYIKNSATGINGTLTIKAYIDADRIAISDTYNPNAVEPIPNGNGQGSGTQNKTSNKKGKIKFLTGESNPITDEYGTTSEWVNGRTVFTTEEWNSFATTPISFKIRAESNEGIWVEKPSKSIESCPGCKYIYRVVNPEDSTTWLWTTWNMGGNNQTTGDPEPITPTQITSGIYDNYEELIATTGKNYFLGVKINNNNEVTNAYACGVKDNVPFCIEGKLNSGLGGTEAETTYAINQSILQGANLYNNTCTVGGDTASVFTQCGPWDNSGSLSAHAGSDGNVDAGVGDDDCGVRDDGYFRCTESGSGGGGGSPK